MKYLLLACFFYAVLPIYSQVGIGTVTPDPSAVLDISSGTGGLLPPRLTTTQRDMISSPALGLFIFNTSTDCLNFYNGTRWEQFCGDPAAILECTNQSLSGSLIAGSSASSVSIDLPYTAGDGTAYSGIAIASTGVPGLTATLTAGTLATGAGVLTFQITGTPDSPGTATFSLSLFRQICDLEIEVTSLCGTGIGLGLNDLNGGTFTIDGDVVTTSTTGTTISNSTAVFTRCNVTTGDSFYDGIGGGGGTVVVTFSRSVNNVKLVVGNLYPGSNATVTTNSGGTRTLSNYVNDCPTDFVISGNSLSGNGSYPNAVVDIEDTLPYTVITINVTQDNTYYGFCFETAVTP